MPGAATICQHTSKNAATAAYLFRVELPSPAVRYLRESPQRMGDGHIQVHLKAVSAVRKVK